MSKEKLINAGVRNLKEFGYPSVSKDNITNDEVFASLFRSMLVDNKGMGMDEEIDSLISEIDKNLSP
jgi:hypothetical protein